MFFYASAALAQPVWDSLFQRAEHEVGGRIVMATRSLSDLERR